MSARPRPLAATVAAVVGTLLVAGCSSGGEPSARSPETARTPGSASSPATTPEATPVATPRFRQYVALGDSYTSAPGLDGPVADERCGRALGNYPHLLGDALDVGELVDVSCGGASTADVSGPQGPDVPPQLDAVGPATDLVTIGLGGNDLELFGTLLQACLQRGAARADGSPCADRLGPEVPHALAAIQRNLRGVVAAVRERAPRARVVLVGYPQLVPATGTCDDVPFAPGDYPFARSVNHGFTEAVRRAAAAEKVTYVDVWAASEGHDICSSEPWVNGFSGPGAAPFHPFAAEQQAVAGLIADALG